MDDLAIFLRKRNISVIFSGLRVSVRDFGITIGLFLFYFDSHEKESGDVYTLFEICVIVRKSSIIEIIPLIFATLELSP